MNTYCPHGWIIGQACFDCLTAERDALKARVAHFEELVTKFATVADAARKVFNCCDLCSTEAARLGHAIEELDALKGG